MNTATSFFEFLLRTSGEAIVIVFLVLLVQRIVRKHISPAARHALWWVVIVRLMLPWFPESSVSVFNLKPAQSISANLAENKSTRTSTRLSPASIDATDTPPVLPEEEAATSGQTRKEIIAPSTQYPEASPIIKEETFEIITTPNITSTTFEATAQPSPTLPSRIENKSVQPSANNKDNRQQNWKYALAGIWYLGVLTFFIRVLWGCLRMHQALRRSTILDDLETLNLIKGCSKASSIKRVPQVLETSIVSSPALCCVLRPTLLLPPNARNRYSKEELRHIFLHELAHLKRRDHWTNWLITLLQMIHWFNPVLWYAFSRMRSDRELAADDLALRISGDIDATSYGATILKTLRQISCPTSITGLVGIMENKKRLKQRFEILSAFVPRRKFSKAILCVTFIPIALLTLTNAVQSTPAVETNNDTTQETEIVDEQKVEQPIAKTIRVTVVHAETGVPVENARVTWRPNGRLPEGSGFTDASGQFDVPFPFPMNDEKYVSIFAQRPGLTGQSKTIQPKGETTLLPQIPDTITMELSSGVEIGGKVLDDSGNPLSGISVSINVADPHFHTSGTDDEIILRNELNLIEEDGLKSDENGNWTIGGFPELSQGLYIRLIRPGGVEAKYMWRKGTPPSFIQNWMDLSKLLNKEQEFILLDGDTVTGKVINEQGIPIQGATIHEYLGLTPRKTPWSAVTDRNGAFTGHHRTAKQAFYTASHPDYATTSVIADLEQDPNDIRIVMSPRQHLAGKVIDKEGSPLPNAKIYLYYQNENIASDWETYTDESGCFEWNHAPIDPCLYEVQASGLDRKALWMNPQTSPWEIMLDSSEEKPLTIKAHVTDAQSGSPVKNIQYAIWFEPISTSRARYSNSSNVDHQGYFEKVIPAIHQGWRHNHTCRIKIIAPGYQTFVTRRILRTEGEVQLNIAMEKPETTIKHLDALTFLNPDGTPASITAVTLVGGGFESMPNLFQWSGPGDLPDSFKTSTDEQGKLRSYHIPSEFRGLVAMNQKGCTSLSKEALIHGTSIIQLKPYGKISGILDPGGSVRVGKQVGISIRFNDSVGLFDRTANTPTDQNGRFEFKQIPEGTYSIYQHAHLQSRQVVGVYQREITVRAGKTTEVSFNDSGRSVWGQIHTLPPNTQVDWNWGNYFLKKIGDSPRLSPPQVRDYINRNRFDEAYRAWRSRSVNFTGEKQYPLDFQSSGFFQASNIPPGEYELSVVSTEPPFQQPNRSKPFSSPETYGSMVTKVTIPEGPMDEPVNLGEFELEYHGPNKPMTKNELPELTLNDGTVLRKSDWRGKLNVLYFYSWGAEKRELDLLNAAWRKSWHHQEMGQINFARINLHIGKLNEREATLLRKSRSKSRWPEALLDGKETYKWVEKLGIEEIPVVALIDDEERLIGKFTEPMQLENALNLMVAGMSRKP